MYRVLKEDLRWKPYKMMIRDELTEHYERMRAERSRHILNEIAQDTLPNLVFTNEKKFDIQEIVNHQNDRVWSSSSSVEEAHFVFHEQRCMASKEPRPQSLELYYLLHFGDKSLSYPSHFSRVPQSKTAKGMGSNSARTDTCH
ncbi:hypothetical protein FHG87_009282 [Trinorchestia longiramus]|nr:hypothetical protein FHG87_009282 [Trinorchestia longiramus]